MTGRSEEQKQTYRMIEFFRKELQEVSKRSKSGIQVMIGREDKVQFALMDPNKDVSKDEDLDMSGAEADQTFLRAYYDDLIGASFGSGGPHATTAIAFVTHITPKGLRVLNQWEGPPEQATNKFTFNAPAYGMFGSQQYFTFEQIVQDFDRQIEEHGGEDKEELREMVAEIQQTLESQDSITRTKFEKWSDLAHKHMPWLLEPMGTLFIKYLFGTPT